MCPGVTLSQSMVTCKEGHLVIIAPVLHPKLSHHVANNMVREREYTNTPYLQEFSQRWILIKQLACCGSNYEVIIIIIVQT